MVPFLMLPVHLLLLKQAVAGTPLHIRLTSGVGSYESKAGMPVSGVLIAPVTTGDDTLIPTGSMLSGTVTRVSRVGLGIVHETATLALDFNQVTLPDGKILNLSTRVRQVDNGREQVAKDGSILGSRTTGSISYRASGYIRTLLCWEVHARLAIWAVKMLLVQVPEPEIYYPAGSELTLALTEPIFADPQPEPIETAELSWKDRGDLDQVIANLPDRAYVRATSHSSARPSDLINTMFIGSREELAASFKAAGWTETKAPSMRARILNIRAVAEFRGDLTAPMSTLLVNDAEPDLALQKGLNDVAKRHHIRIWKQAETLDGEDIWIGAATRDIDYAFLRPGRLLTHQIETEVDHERDKVTHDLQFTDCAKAVDWWDRPGFPQYAKNATGDFMSTDGRLVVIRLNGCASPHVAADNPNAGPLRAHGGKLQRLARREILSVRSDLYRHNIIWRGYEGTRWVVSAIRKRHQSSDPSTGDFDKSETVAGSTFSKVLSSSWLR